MGAPYFTVITPSWNQGKFLGSCIGSVVSQNDPDFEHLVFDNRSTDGTARVMEDFPHVQFVSEPDRGQSHAVNKGLAAAKGEIICGLNSDDEYAPGTFARLRAAFSNPATNVVFGDVKQVSYDGRGETVLEARFGSRLDFIRWWRSDVKLHQPAVFFRRKVAVETGFLREDLHLVLDYEYWWRISEKFDFQHIPGVLAIQHRQPDSKTVRAWHIALKEREKVFSPYYDLIDRGGRRQLMREKRQFLVRLYLMSAWSCLDSDPCLARSELLRAVCQSPSCLFSSSVAGLLRRLVFCSRRV